MQVLFEQDGLQQLDRLGCEALILPLFEDERPPRGALGRVDWRFAGMISRLIERGIVRAELGSRSVIPARRRLPAIDKLFVLGLGPSEAFCEALYDRAVEDVLALSESMKLKTFGLALPGRSLGLISPVQGIERFLPPAERALRGGEVEVTILDDQDALRAMEPLVALARRRTRARHEG